MSDAISPAGGAAGNHLPGVTVAVLRKALDLMEVQGEALVTMIDSASEMQAAAEMSRSAAAASASAPQALSDPLAGQQVDLLA